MSQATNPINVTLPASDWRSLHNAAKNLNSAKSRQFCKLVAPHLKATEDVTLTGRMESFRAIVGELKAAKVFKHVWAPLDTRLNQIANAVLPEDMANAKLAAQRMDADPNWRSFDLEGVKPEPAPGVKQEGLF